jgi:signal transduction histidine kinase
METSQAPFEIAELIFEHLSQPAILLDSDFNGILANKSFYSTLSIALDAVIAQPIDKLIVDGPRLRKRLETLLHNKINMEQLEITCTTRNGERKVLSIDAQCLPRERNADEYVLLEFRDITAETSAASEIATQNSLLAKHALDLERSNRELDTFAHSVSHDLRTPLRFLSRICHMLLDKHADDLSADAVQLVNMIRSATGEMGSLIESLLRFSQITREPVAKRPVNMQELVVDALDDLDITDQFGNTEIVVDELPAALGDHTLIKQLLINLLQNALKFTRDCPSPRIHVGCTDIGVEKAYFVSDNGLGFETNELEEMFLLFRRFHKRHNIPGSGIGLAIAKRIVERHGGRIWAEGEAEAGAKFYFTLGQEQDTVSGSDGKT